MASSSTRSVEGLVVGSLTAVVLIGCGDVDSRDAGDGPAADTTTETSHDDGPPKGQQRATSSRSTFDFTITPDHGSYPLNEPFGVTVELFDHTTGERLTEFSEATIDARMPAHKHGMKHDVELVPRPDGTYRAENMLFHMVGHWEIHLDVTRGAKVERAQTSVNLEF